MERQVTHAPQGHVLTNAGVWSPDGRWIVYDVRSDAAGSVFDGERIERVDVETGRVEVLYQCRNGARCGVATCSPVDDRVAFILGPEADCGAYAPYHRRGVIVQASRPGVATNLDACNVLPPFTPGALRGGTHVHTFSGDGAWVAFTYEDQVLAEREGVRTDNGAAAAELNQRNVGVSVPGRAVDVPPHPRNHGGAFFSVLATRTVNQPRPGSDEICRAYEDAWVGVKGYRRADGGWQRRALAFLGDVIDAEGRSATEVFLVALPDDVTAAGVGPLEGTATRRPAPPALAVQRRLTRTAERLHRGVQGPRHWPRSSPDGGELAFLMRDEAGAVQLWSVSPTGGEPRQITSDSWSVASAFTWSPGGERIAYVADGSVMTVDVASGRSRRHTATDGGATDGPRPEACVWSPCGRRIAVVRQVSSSAGRFNQVFVVEI